MYLVPYGCQNNLEDVIVSGPTEGKDRVKQLPAPSTLLVSTKITNPSGE